jgi:hypothetical protein
VHLCRIIRTGIDKKTSSVVLNIAGGMYSEIRLPILMVVFDHR